ncbi:MarR family winged helix-turn-helix transcriptional regulator [Nocardioides sp. zg-1228]|uniref:MarR family winged helix-turn-helix transcriptional regulator n=1 Tax=Nocardioides sp. zg-1228 TaxID=2763008 RepID=UPI001642A7B9|nr:MarR family transcriptional regulator [Nocardioides sp. zg-1228]MBC2931582.1 MarR family transcriptional regulator [Nocardioides sp. zg-1228]QSF57180.1 MarR family transcriptional regulator [Nocardioides sp. zg-1228]
MSTGDQLGSDLSLRVIMFHEAIARRLGITNSEHKLLDVVAQHPEGVSPSDLASRTGLSNPAITKLVSSLEAAGYVSRRRNEADGRSVLVELAGGYDVTMRPSTSRISERIHALSSTFSPEEVAAIERWLTGVIDVLKAETQLLEAATE